MQSIEKQPTRFSYGWIGISYDQLKHNPAIAQKASHSVMKVRIQLEAKPREKLPTRFFHRCIGVCEEFLKHNPAIVEKASYSVIKSIIQLAAKQRNKLSTCFPHRWIGVRQEFQKNTCRPQCGKQAIHLLRVGFNWQQRSEKTAYSHFSQLDR